MRAAALPNCAPQHILSPEAASALNNSLILARRRGHAQLTPLHVAATLLASSSSSFFKRACIKSQPHFFNAPSLIHYPRALELCFNVALNRLPSSASYYGRPPPSCQHVLFLSNALIAALKRAQACVRRGCVEAVGGAVRVEVEQLVLSILDDPSVSRVMKEAGFSSISVKVSLENSFTTTDRQSPFKFMSSKEDAEVPWSAADPPGLSLGGSSGLDSRIPRTVARFRRQQKMPCCHGIDGNELKISLSLEGNNKRKADYDHLGEVRTKRRLRAFDLNAEASVDECEENETSSSDLSTLEDQEFVNTALRRRG